MKRLLWLIPIAGIGWLGYAVYQKRNEAPEVAFAPAERERLVSALVTNGKVEPLDWAAVRAEREGSLARLTVEKGQNVRKADMIGELDTSDARSDLASAEARIAQVKAELAILDSGGRVRDLAEIDAAIRSAKVELAQAEGEQKSLATLVEKKAATPYELQRAKERRDQLEASIHGLESRRNSFVSGPDKDAAKARLADAENSAALARRKIEMGTIRAPMSGTFYQLEVRKGAFLRPGDLIGQIGVLDQVRVKVFVDEPELGGVKTGQPVTISWDALPGKTWEGTVEKLPTEIVAVNSRQVGEVICNIANPGRLLLPATNVNAEIRLQVVENALTVPKEVLRRDKGEAGVFILQKDRVLWKPVKLGAASITRIQILSGIGEKELAALPLDTPLRDGMIVKPVTR